jgi:peptide/nickel transport system substrate-binding protein
VVSYNPGVKTVLQRNPDYWKKPEPYLDEVDFVVIPEETTRVTALESGSVDMITALPPDRIASLRSEGFNIVEPNAMNLVWFFSINMRDPAMADVRVRQAINYAINREDMAKDLLAGAVVPTSVMLPRTSPLWNEKLANAYPYDPEKAKALLKAAGVTNGITAKLQLPAGGSYMITPVPMAEAVQRDLAAVGIKLELQTFDWVTYLGYWVKGMKPDVAMNTMAWGTDYSEWWAADVFMSKGFGNSGRINDPTIDKLFADYESATKQADADAIARKIFQRATDQAYFVPICSDLAPIATASKVRGVIPIPDWMQDFRRIWIAQ